jgi:hypothetical protein
MLCFTASEAQKQKQRYLIMNIPPVALFDGLVVA